MFRRTVWRNTVSDAVSSHQDQALNTTILLLKSFGPTGFLLREEGGSRNFKVLLGDPHTCTCPVFTREQEPCKHICWVLLRKFRLPREHEYSFQHGLVERQILEVLHGLHHTKAHRMENDPAAASGTPGQALTDQEPGSVCRKVIQAQDVCPICQEELLEKKQPVSYCRFGCGNNVHISCMKVWADHQKLSDREETVKCPLCREQFSSLKLLQEQAKNAARLFTAAEREKADRHLGVVCHSCRVCPVTGKCFKCTVCPYFYLCEDCWKKGCHPYHPFAARTKRREKWRLVAEDPSYEPMGATSHLENDSMDPLPEAVLGCLPTVRVRTGNRLLDDGQQCRICLQDFSLGHRVRTLPCHHKFHTDCVDGTLRKSNCCPLDGYVIYNPLTWRTSDQKTSPQLSSGDDGKQPENSLQDLFIPGVGLQDRNAKATPSRGSLNLQVLTGSSVTLKSPENSITESFQGLCMTGNGSPLEDTVSKERRRKSQRKQTLLIPENTSSFDHLSKDIVSNSSRKRVTNHSHATPNMCAAGTKIREQPQLNLSVGVWRPESDRPVMVSSVAARRTRLQPKRTGTVTKKDQHNGLISELIMTGVLINTQHQRNTET